MEQLVAPIIDRICKSLKRHRSLSDDMNELRGLLGDLNRRKSDVEEQLSAELCIGKRARRTVQNWLTEVVETYKDVESIEQCFGRVNYFFRASLGKRVEEKANKIKELQRESHFPDGLTVVDPEANKLEIPTTDLVGEVDVKQKIWSYVVGNEVGKIGVCGMGGVGKTTIVKHIHNKLLAENAAFDKVIWITVSKEFRISELQNKIAHAFNKYFSLEEDITMRAAILAEVLKDKKFVLILDDVWKRFHLEEVGIPDSFTNTDERKLILTTRNKEVCRSMGCEMVEVKPLSEGEAWNLFSIKVGFDVLLTPTLESTAKLIVKECGGLPLAIIVIAGSMKGVHDAQLWRNALNELRGKVEVSKDLENDVYDQLKFSYDRLENINLKKCLLFCSLYPDDEEIPKQELIENMISDGIIKEMGGTIQSKNDKGHTIIHKLESNFLLENAKNDKALKMHDLVRDMARHVMKETAGDRFMVKASSQLEEFPNDQAEWSMNLEKVYLMWNWINKIPSNFAPPKCPGLSTLFLQHNPLESIPDSFFMHMVGLQILDLSHTKIKTLPNSISDLVSLTELLLYNCWKLKTVLCLSKLGQLRKLVLRDTSIREVPLGMEMLVKLVHLDLHTEHLKEMPEGILPKLSRLQYLSLFPHSEVKARAEELEGLLELEHFEGQLHNLGDFNKYIQFLNGGRGLNEYFLCWGSSRICSLPGLYGKTIGLAQWDTWGGSGVGQVLLPTDIQQLFIIGCPNNFKSLSYIYSCQGMDCFVDLRDCHIYSCKGMECIVDLSYSTTAAPFQSLLHLRLVYLDDLKALMTDGMAPPPPIPPGIFLNLKIIDIFSCNDIKKLFSPALLMNLQNLEVIEVSRCIRMEEIIGGGEEEGRNITVEKFSLPKLRELRLEHLPELKSICSISGELVCDSVQKISIISSPRLKRIPLALPQLENGQLSPPPSLTCIRMHEDAWETLDWDDPSAKVVLQPLLFPQ